MSNQIDLLRMLEPAVRPGNTPTPVRPIEPPFEQQDFESLLETAREQMGAEGADGVAAPDQADEVGDAAQPLDTLRDVGIIENESLRRLLSGCQPPGGMND